VGYRFARLESSGFDPLRADDRFSALTRRYSGDRRMLRIAP
jgi:hypothetical protein